MSDNTPAAVPAGWYPDPAGSPSQRWWNGSSWSESVQERPAPSPYGSPQPYGASPYGAQPYSAQPYSAQPYSAQPYGSGPQQYAALRAPEGTNPTTPHVWAIALWPLLGLVAGVIVGVLTYAAPTYDAAIGLGVGLPLVLNFFLWLGFATVAYLDSRELKNRGVPAPFGWGWGFIPIVYVIGRSVVVHSRTGTGLTPLWVWIGCTVLSYAVPFFVSAAQTASYYN